MEQQAGNGVARSGKPVEDHGILAKQMCGISYDIGEHYIYIGSPWM